MIDFLSHLQCWRHHRTAQQLMAFLCEAAVLALDVGCDLLLCPQDYCSAFDAVLDAVNSGRIPLERLEESVLRILQLKEAYGILS